MSKTRYANADLFVLLPIRLAVFVVLLAVGNSLWGFPVQTTIVGVRVAPTLQGMAATVELWRLDTSVSWGSKEMTLDRSDERSDGRGLTGECPFEPLIGEPLIGDLTPGNDSHSIRSVSS